MKPILAILLLLSSFTLASAKEDRLAQKMKGADSVVWMGIDYSLMRMIGTPHTIKAPDLLFQDMPAKWNDLFLDERIEGVAGALKKRIDIDIAGVTERNKQLNRQQMILDSQTKEAIKQSHITPKDIADTVQSLKASRKDGLGLMFIVDRMVSERRVVMLPPKSPVNTPPAYIFNAEAVYVVFFDLATRDVFSAKREERPL